MLYAGGKSADYQPYAAPADGSGPPVTILRSPGSLYVHDTAADGRMLVTREEARHGVAAKGLGQSLERDLSVMDQSWTPLLTRDRRSVIRLLSPGVHAVPGYLRR